MDPQDWLSFQQQRAGTPDIFYISLNPAAGTVIFTVGTTNQGRGRAQVASYNIHFVKFNDVPASIIFDYNGALEAFKVSNIVLSTGAPGPGGVVTVSSTSQYGKAGYYFAAPVTQSGYESSYFAGPKQAPTINGIVQAATPPDVSNPDVDIVTETVNGRSVRRANFTAVIPFNGHGVIAVAVLNTGTGYGTIGTHVPLVFTGGGGTGAEAIGTVDANGGIGSVLVSKTGAGYTGIPTATAPPGGAVFAVYVGDAAEFAGYQIYLDNYFLGSLQESVFCNGVQGEILAGYPMTGTLLLLPDSAVGAHDVDFYFVSVSPTGVRKIDPTTAPKVTVSGGIV